MGHTDTNSNGTLRISVKVALQVVAYIVAVLLAYAAVSTDIAVLKNEINTTEKRLERIENKVDRLLERWGGPIFRDAPLPQPEGSQ